MASCHVENVAFDAPVFSLRSRRERGICRMLCAATQAKERDTWRLEFTYIQADASTGRAHWKAHYRFSTTGRLVHSIIDVRFTFHLDELIATNRDRYNFWRRSRQALGTPGLLLGWTPFLQV